MRAPNPASPATAAGETLDVTAPSLYLHGIPHDRFAAMRAAPGLTWHRYGEGGFWAVTRHGDVRAVSRRPEVFSSEIGHTNLWDLEADALEARRSLIDTDPRRTTPGSGASSAAGSHPATLRAWAPRRGPSPPSCWTATSHPVAATG